MSIVAVTGSALILSTLIYHSGLAILFGRAEFAAVLNRPRQEKLLIIARHTGPYRWGCRLVLAGWIVAASGYVLLAVSLHEAGDGAISTLAATVFLIAIAAAIVFWAFHVSPTIWAAAETARTSVVPQHYEILEVSAEASLRVYVVLGLLATAGFGWALLQTGMLPSWVGWLAVAWGLLWSGVTLRGAEGIPLLPMVIPAVIGVALVIR
jgi:hypothetical protein